MNMILDSSLSTGEDMWPLAVPSSRLTFRALLSMVGISEKKIGEKIEVFLSPYETSNLESLLTEGELHELQRFIEFKIDENPPRHDFCNGEWVRRELGSIEYANATCEDVVILTPWKNKTNVLRVRRTPAPIDARGWTC